MGSIPVSALTTSSRCIAVYKTGVLSSGRKLQREKISYWCFQSLDTLPCFSTYLMYINEACACLRKHALWSCTQGSVPIQLLHHHRCHPPLRATPSAPPTSHAPLPSAPPHLPRLTGKLSSPGDPRRPYSLCQKIFTVGSGSPSPGDKKTFFTTEPDCV